MVAVLRPEPFAGRQVPRAPQDLRPVERRGDPEQIVARQPAAVGEQVADGQLAADVSVLELEGGEVVRHRVVPAQLPLVHQHPQRRHRHRLGGGGDGEERVLVHPLRPAGLADAVAAGEGHRVAPHHRDREPRHLPLPHRPLHVGVQPPQRSGLAPRRGREQGQQQDGGEERGRSEDGGHRPSRHG